MKIYTMYNVQFQHYIITGLPNIDVKIFQISEMLCDYYSNSFFFQNLEVRMDTVHVKRSMERNREMGIGDFYLAKLGDGQVVTNGSLSLKEVQLLISNQILTTDSLDTSKWLPTSAPPTLPMPIEKLGSKPTLLKKTAVAYKNWLLSVSNVKPGEGSFLGWSFPVDRDLFVETDNLMPGLNSSRFTLSKLVNWKILAQIKNGFGSGSTALLEPGTGISSWLAFLKIFIEVNVLHSCATSNHYKL